MIKVNVRTSTIRHEFTVAPDATINDLLNSAEAQELDLASIFANGSTQIDGMTARDFNKSFADYGVMSGSMCTLSNIAKHDNAGC